MDLIAQVDARLHGFNAVGKVGDLLREGVEAGDEQVVGGLERGVVPLEPAAETSRQLCLVPPGVLSRRVGLWQSGFGGVARIQQLRNRFLCGVVFRRREVSLKTGPPLVGDRRDRACLRHEAVDEGVDVGRVGEAQRLDVLRRSRRLTAAAALLRSTPAAFASGRGGGDRVGSRRGRATEGKPVLRGGDFTHQTLRRGSGGGRAGVRRAGVRRAGECKPVDGIEGRDQAVSADDTLQSSTALVKLGGQAVEERDWSRRHRRQVAIRGCAT